MGDWYYVSSGERNGPTSEEGMKELVANGTINSRTLVWIDSFGDDWKPLGDTVLSSPIAPKPANGPPPLPKKNDNISDDELPRKFLSSELAKTLIGKNQDYYLANWVKLLEKSAFDAKQVTKQRSWNWAAFFIPYAWLFYRKLYMLGSLAVAALLFGILTGRATYVVSIAVSIVTAVYGNAWYFDATYKKWLKLRTIADPGLAGNTSATEGGTSLAMAVFAGAIFFVGAAALSSDLFNSDVSCTSDSAKNLVAQIAREQIDKDGYMMFVVDSQKTKISLGAIRTQDTSGGKVNCAASITYSIVTKGGGGDSVVTGALEQALNKEIKYKVEKTDKGDQIYVTVFGLQ
jgi:hypothetical protein